jgi:transketolase
LRDEFVRVLTDIARHDSSVMLLTGDLGFGVLTQFASEFPQQYVNAGVAEQNMTSLAVGLALEGKTVFTYSIANFPTLRCLEQIRNGACYHQANVKIVAVGGGFAYGALGISHHATEDLAVMRSLPNMTVVAPGDPIEVSAATRAVYRNPGTCYLRLGRGGEPLVHGGPIDFALGRGIKLLGGTDTVYLATGGILAKTHQACKALHARGRNVALYSMPTVKPLDRELIEELGRQFRQIVTVEEHSVTGGFGGAVAEVLAQMDGPRAALRVLGLRSGFSSIVGDQEYLRNAYGLSQQEIERAEGGAERWMSSAGLGRVSNG